MTAARLPSFPSLEDPFARRVSYLRVSVTDACNLRCVYCMPAEGRPREPKAPPPARSELDRLVSLLVLLGVRKVRVTGGEPTTRPDLVEIVRDLGRHRLPGGLALSTNGVRFAPLAADLRRAGLTGVNFSLDAVTEEGFLRMSRRERLGDVLEALDVALSLEFRFVKVNAVVMRGWNDGEVDGLVDLARRRPVEVRFIELMPFEASGWDPARLVPGSEIRALVERTDPLEPLPRGDHSGPARVFTSAGWAGRIGFVSPMSDGFCGGCNRVRLTSEGRLRACLFAGGEVDLLGPLRAGAGDDELAALVRQAVALKVPSHGGRVEASGNPRMNAIGG